MQAAFAENTGLGITVEDGANWIGGFSPQVLGVNKSSAIGNIRQLLLIDVITCFFFLFRYHTGTPCSTLLWNMD